MTTPAYKDLTAEQREELRAVYVTVHNLHHIPFEHCLLDTAFRICLWNVAQARRRKRARLAAATQVFELKP